MRKYQNVLTLAAKQVETQRKSDNHFFAAMRNDLKTQLNIFELKFYIDC